MRHPLTIVSGGQTGVDRGALDAALAREVPCGGWCPEHRWAEDGPIPDHYPLQEVPGGDVAARTRRNVVDSDGTLILHTGPLTGGTALTLRCCREQGRPVCCIDASVAVSSDEHLQQVRTFLAEHTIHRLNVAGPRESGWPGASAWTRAFIGHLLV